jgi:hypothetical protein
MNVTPITLDGHYRTITDRLSVIFRPIPLIGILERAEEPSEVGGELTLGAENVTGLGCLNIATGYEIANLTLNKHLIELTTRFNERLSSGTDEVNQTLNQ